MSVGEAHLMLDSRPVDLWVMDVPNEAEFKPVQRVAHAVFGDTFKWFGPLPSEKRKGVVRQIEYSTAEIVANALDAAGARTLIDEDAYLDDVWGFFRTTPEDNEARWIAQLRRYLDDCPSRDGVLTVAIVVTSDGMVMRTAARWVDDDLAPNPPFPCWDELVTDEIKVT